MINYLELSGVGIEFDTNGSKFRALQNVNLKLDKGEFVSLIGHSGCGKSTVLNMAAGLSTISKGAIKLDGFHVMGADPERAEVGVGELGGPGIIQRVARGDRPLGLEGLKVAGVIVGAEAEAGAVGRGRGLEEIEAGDPSAALVVEPNAAAIDAERPRRDLGDPAERALEVAPRGAQPLGQIDEEPGLLTQAVGRAERPERRTLVVHPGPL